MQGKLLVPVLVVVAAAIGAAIWTFSDSSSSEPETRPEVGKTDGSGFGPEKGLKPTPPDKLPKVPTTGNVGEAIQTTRDTVKPSVFDPSGVLTVIGKVTSAATKQPVADAEVEVLYPNGDGIDSAMTEEDGTYRLAIEEGIPPVVAIRAKAEGFSAKVMADVKVDKETRDLTADFELPAAFAIVGRVISMKDGAAVEDAEIEVRSVSEMFEDDWDSDETDASGNYKIEDVTDLPRDKFDVIVESSGHSPQIKSGLSIPDGQNELRVDFQLWEAFTLKGVVTSAADGQPVADAQVFAASPDPNFEDDGTDDVTEEDGSFEVEVDAIPFDGMFVLVTSDDFAAVAVAPVPQPDRNGVIDLGRIALQPAPRLLGVVVDKASGLPIPGGEVSVYPFNAPLKDEGDFGTSESIDANGRFEMALTSSPLDTAEILIEAKDCFPVRQRLNIPVGQNQIELRFEVERQIVLSGLVTRPADQSPVAAARIRLLAAPGVLLEDEPYTRTRPDGTYKIELPAGDVGRFAIVAEYGPKRVPIGRLNAGEVTNYSIVRNFTMDVPKLERPKVAPTGPDGLPKDMSEEMRKRLPPNFPMPNRPPGGNVPPGGKKDG